MNDEGYISNEDNTVTLELEDGGIVEFEILGKFDYGDDTYVGLISEDDEAMLLGCIEEGDGFYLRMLEEEEFDAAWDEFERILEEEW